MPFFELNELIYGLLKKKTISYNYEELREKILAKIYSVSMFYFANINLNYVKSLLQYEKIKILCYCLNDTFSIKNTVSMIFYHKTTNNNINKYYILLFGIHDRYRNCGYGKCVLDEFVNYIKSKKTKYQNKILLKTVSKSYNFYLEYGFVKAELSKNKLFYKYENMDGTNNDIDKILEYIIL